MKYLIGGGLLLLVLLVGVGAFLFGGDDQTMLRGGERSAVDDGDAGARRDLRRPADYRRVEDEASGSQPAGDDADHPASGQVLLAAGRILNQRGEPVAGARITLGLGGDEDSIGAVADSKPAEPTFIYATLSETAGEFELRGPRTSKRSIRLIAEREGYFDCVQTCAPGSRGVDIVLPQESIILGRLVAAPGTSLTGVQVLLVSEGVTMTGSVGPDGDFRFSVPRGSYDLVVTGGYNHTRLVEQSALRIEAGDIVKLGDILVADTSIVLHIRLDAAGEMVGLTGLIEVLEVNTERSIAEQAVSLVEPATDIEITVPALPVELRCLFNGLRRLRYRIEKPVARLALEPGIKREIIVEFDGTLVEGAELGIKLSSPECRDFGYAASVKTTGAATAVLLPEFGNYVLTWTLIETASKPSWDDLDGSPSRFPLGSGEVPTSIVVSPDEPGPIKVRLSDEMQRELRDDRGALR